MFVVGQSTQELGMTRSPYSKCPVFFKDGFQQTCFHGAPLFFVVVIIVLQIPVDNTDSFCFQQENHLFHKVSNQGMVVGYSQTWFLSLLAKCEPTCTGQVSLTSKLAPNGHWHPSLKLRSNTFPYSKNPYVESTMSTPDQTTGRP